MLAALSRLLSRELLRVRIVTPGTLLRWYRQLVARHLNLSAEHHARCWAPAHRCGDPRLIRFDTGIGKHGDTGRSELDAIDAVLAGDAAAIGINTWESIGREQLMPGALEQVWQTEQYCLIDRGGPRGLGRRGPRSRPSQKRHRAAPSSS